MAKIDLVRFLSNSAGEALKKAESAAPDVAQGLLDEAEEFLALATSVLNRPAVEAYETLEAA